MEHASIVGHRFRFEKGEKMERSKLYKTLDIITTVAACVYIGAKVGRRLIIKYMKKAKKVEK
jgi:hypothetical protein